MIEDHLSEDERRNLFEVVEKLERHSRQDDTLTNGNGGISGLTARILRGFLEAPSKVQQIILDLGFKPPV